MMDLIGLRRYGYLLSGILVAVCLVFILGTFLPGGNMGLQFSIAYSGGTVWEVHFEDGTPDPAEVRAVLAEQGLSGEVAITEADDREYVLIRTEALLQEATVAEGSAAAALAASPQPDSVGSPAAETTPPSSAQPTTTPEDTAEPSASPAASASPEPSASPAASASPEPSASPAASASPGASPAAAASTAPEASPAASVAPTESAGAGGTGTSVPTEGPLGALATALQAEFGPIDEVRQENSVGPVVSQELIWQTLTLILAAAVAIMLWVAYRFRDWRMGVTALVALLHDVIITVGAFAILGTLIGLEIDSLFVTAMLTVIGFSVHDTIVVFDRIRENRQRYVGEPLIEVVNHSLVQTFGRSVTTSLTLILTLLALLLFGGEAIRAFTLALLIGVTAGTYSSLFVATPMFLDWHLWADRRAAARPAEATPNRRPA